MVEIGEYEVREGLYYHKEHFWAKIEDGLVRFGATDYGQKALREVVFVELPEEGDCCGFGGVFSIAHPELSAEFLKRKIDNLEKTQAPTLVVADTGWIMHIAGGLHRQKKTQKVIHIAEVLNHQ